MQKILRGKGKFLPLIGFFFLMLTISLGVYILVGERDFDERSEAFLDTASIADDMIRFAVIGDGHWGSDGVSGVTYQERHRRVVDWFNAEAKGKGLDFVVFNGDLVHNNASWWISVKSWYDRLDVPYYVTHGNHDSGSFSAWNQLWGMSYDYDFEYKGYGFVLLGIGTEYRLQPYESRLWNYNFLVDRSQKYIKENKPVFVITHVSFDHPNYGGDYDGTYGTAAQRYHDYIRKEPLIRAAIFSHNHYRRGSRIYDGQVYFYSGHFSQRPEPTDTPPGYRIVEISRSTGAWRSYWVNGNTKATGYSYSAPTCGTHHRKTFSASQQTWPTGSFCLQGDPSPLKPLYPSTGGTTNWECKVSTTTTSCWAKRAEEVKVAKCGTHHQKTFSASQQTWPSGNFCSEGVSNPINPSYPSFGQTTNWECKIDSSTSSCWAKRAEEVKVAKCGTHHQKTFSTSQQTWPSGNFCSEGVSNPINPSYPSFGQTTNWECRIGQEDEENSIKSCVSSSDCIPVGCGCDCSGCGGFAYEDIVNKEYVDEWYEQKGCKPPEICVQVCCPAREVACEKNFCVVKEGLTDSSPSSCWAKRAEEVLEPPPPSENECETNDDCRRIAPFEICSDNKCIRGDIIDNGNIGIRDFSEFKKDFISFKKNGWSEDLARSDFDMDQRISMSDYSVFVRSYRAFNKIDR